MSSPETSSQEEPAWQVTRPRLLIVDDEPMMLGLFKSMFTSVDFDCDYATSHPEAAALCNSGRHYSLILLDISLPDQAGHDLCRLIRRDYLPSELPIIAVTGEDKMEDMADTFALGINDYLQKPFTQIELLTKIKAHLTTLEFNSSFQRFIPREFLKQLGRNSIVNIDLGDQVEGEMTVLFVDMREFTKMSEMLTPKENFQFLNNYFKAMTPLIRSCSGFIDKFVGDAIMALFPEKPDDAIRAAKLMVRSAHDMEVPVAIQSQAPIRIGVGIHTGRVMLGTVGDEQRMDVTVISDAVNIASRLESLTKEYNCSIAVSADTIKKCHHPEVFEMSEIGRIHVKGKEKAVSVYKIEI